jgi:hypothetical protein
MDIGPFMKIANYCDKLVYEVKVMGHAVITHWHTVDSTSDEFVLVFYAVINDDAEAVIFKLQYSIDPDGPFHIS